MLPCRCPVCVLTSSRPVTRPEIELLRDGVLEAVGEQLVQQDATGDGNLQAYPHAFALGLEGDTLGSNGVSVGQFLVVTDAKTFRPLVSQTVSAPSEGR